MTVLVEYLFDWQLVEVLRFVVCDLLAVDAEALVEVAVAVQEADGCHVDATVGCFFDIVAGKDTESAGIYFEAVAEAVFHGEI